MTNNPILPIVPAEEIEGKDSGNAAIKMDDDLQRDATELDEGETTDSQEQVERDIRESTEVEENAEK